jgi:hypothetical protein
MVLKVKANSASKSKPKPKAESSAVGTKQTVNPTMPDALAQSALDHDPAQTPTEAVYLPGNFTPQNLVQGVVMAEILGKPRCRNWGRRS